MSASTNHQFYGFAAKIPLKNDGNIFEVTKLQDEKEALKKKMLKLQQQLVEKDKEVCLQLFPSNILNDCLFKFTDIYNES